VFQEGQISPAVGQVPEAVESAWFIELQPSLAYRRQLSDHRDGVLLVGVVDRQALLAQLYMPALISEGEIPPAPGARAAGCSGFSRCT